MEKINIRLMDIVIFILFHACCVKFYYIPNSRFFSILCEFIVLLYLIPKISCLFKKKYVKVNILMLIFIFIGLTSSMMSKTNIEDSVWFFLRIFTFFFFMEYAYEKGDVKNIFKIFGFLFLFYAVLSLIIDIKFHYLFINYNKNYLIGNKFAISYAAFLSLVMYDCYQNNNYKNLKKSNLFIILVFIFTIFVSYKTDCNTGILCCVLYYLISKMNIDKLKSGPMIITTSLISSVLLISFRDFLLNQKIVQYIITNLMHRSMDLSGRIQIYENIFTIINEKKLLGHGFGNSYSILYSRILAPNTQNALLEWWFNSGIFGLLVLLLMFYVIFDNLKKSRINTLPNINCIVNAIFVFLILGSIEVTISTSFFILLAFLNVGYNKEVVNNG